MSLRIELSWPAEQLSPNARVHHMVKHRYGKALEKEAYWATRIIPGLMDWEPNEEPIPVTLEAHPPEGWRTGDADNLVARVKKALDGIAKALDINDRSFAAPSVKWADRCQRGALTIIIGG